MRTKLTDKSEFQLRVRSTKGSQSVEDLLLPCFPLGVTSAESVRVCDEERLCVGRRTREELYFIEDDLGSLWQ